MGAGVGGTEVRVRVTGTRLGAFTLLGLVLLAPGCGGGHGATNAIPDGSMAPVKSVSPASIPAPPMARTAILPSSAMTSVRTPQSAIAPLGWTQLPGGGIFVAASPDGSIWVLSNQGPGPDQSIWHYANGNWSNISGGATRLAVAPDNSLWAVTAAGGIYHYTGSWTQIAGGASDISVGPDGSVYVISNQGGGPFGRGAWRYTNGAWTALPGGGVRVAASWDVGTYLGNITPGTLWVLNTPGDLWYWNAAFGFHNLGGGGVEMAPTSNGGIFVLGFPQGPNGYPLWYNDLSTGTWTPLSGGGVSIATDSAHVYAIGKAGGIYSAPITAPTLSANPSTLAFPLNQTYAAQTVAISGGTAPYTVSVVAATIAQASMSGSTLTVAPVFNAGLGYYNAGSTTATVRDAANNQIGVQVGVTSAVIIIESRRRNR